MIFTPTDLAGAVIVETEARSDDRGAYTRTWCAREFAAHGLNVSLAQSGLSYNRRRGTIRGMHMQAAPHAQTRLVRCGRGAIYDVIIDLRPDSPTYCRWLAIELRAASCAMLYVPEGFAHGFQTLEDHTEVLYHMTDSTSPPPNGAFAGTIRDLPSNGRCPTSSPPTRIATIATSSPEGGRARARQVLVTSTRSVTVISRRRPHHPSARITGRVRGGRSRMGAGGMGGQARLHVHLAGPSRHPAP